MSDFDYRFSIIPGWIVTDPRLKGRDLQVLCLLGRHTNKNDGWCRRSQVKMAAQLDISRSTVQSSLNRLVEFGAVERRIVESPDGRDSAHRYRVIYDREVDSVANSTWDDEDGAEGNEENYPISGASDDTPPADIPAGGADPGPAPPAGSGPAPIKDSYLTTPLNKIEREHAREGEGEESPKAIERRFRRWWSTWPTYATDTEATTRRLWQGLTADQRSACEERTPDYLKAAKASGRKFSKAAATYLSERAWERLGEKTAIATATNPEGYTAYSRPWSAMRLAALSRSPMPLRLNAVEQRVVDDHPEKADLIWRDKREKHGWPEAVRLHQIALDTVKGKRVSVPAGLVELSRGFDKIQIGGPIWDAWKRLHFDRCWPWLPEPSGLEFVQFPALPEEIDDPDEAVDAALRLFQRNLLEGWGNDDAA